MRLTYNFSLSEAPLIIFPSSLPLVRYLEVWICMIRKAERLNSLKIKKTFAKKRINFIFYYRWYFIIEPLSIQHYIFWHFEISCERVVQTNNLKRYLNRYSAKYSVKHLLGFVAWDVFSRDVLNSHYLYLLGVTIEKEKKVFPTP